VLLKTVLLMTLADVWILQDGDLDLIKDASISLAGHGQYM
jgi:hypothetical protein